MSGRGKKKAATKAQTAVQDEEEPKQIMVLAPSIAENKAKRARVVKAGQKISDVIATGRNTEDLSKKYDWKKALSLESQAKWSLDVKVAESDNVDYLVRLCIGEETVSVYTPTLRVRSALISGVGVLSREDSKINQRKYKIKCVGAYDEELLLVKPEIVNEFDEFNALMDQAKYTFYTLVVWNDLLYEAYIKKYEEAALPLKPEWEGTTCRDNPEMLDYVVKTLVKESYTWDKGFKKVPDVDPTFRFAKNVFMKGTYGNDQDETKNNAGAKKGPDPKAKGQENKKPIKKAKQLTAADIRGPQKNSSNQKTKGDSKGDDKNPKMKKLPDREETERIIEEARGLGLKRTTVRVTNNTDGKIICPKGCEGDVMFNPLEQNDYIKLLFWFKPYWLSAATGGGGFGMSLQFDNRGLVFMRKGKGRDEWTPFIKDASTEAEAWSDEAYILRERQRAEKRAHEASNETDGKGTIFTFYFFNPKKTQKGRLRNKILNTEDQKFRGTTAMRKKAKKTRKNRTNTTVKTLEKVLNKKGR